MAITRQNSRDINLRDPRHLRSRRLLYTPPSTRTLLQRTRQASKRYARPSVGHSSHRGDKNASEQSQQPRAEYDPQCVLEPLQRVDRIENDPLAPDFQDRLNIRQERLSSPGTQSPELSEKYPAPAISCQLEAPNRCEADVTSAAIAHVSSVTVLPSPINSAAVGFPKDGKWDIIYACERRFCFQHEEEEWLLKYTDRWMFASDFNVRGAATKLENYLQEYQGLKICRPASNAECIQSLWYQIDAVIGRAKVEDREIFLIRWKLHWTLESKIDHVHWVRSSYKAQNKSTGRRQSGRIRDTAPQRAAKREAMMLVIKLDELLCTGAS